MNGGENLLRAARFESPEWIPMSFHVNAACWEYYDQGALQDLMEAHPFLFPGFARRGEKIVPEYDLNARVNAPYTDPWGCVWETMYDGITGTVTTHPLEDWKDFENYAAPDPDATDGMFPVAWDVAREEAVRAGENGGVRRGDLPHGHTFLRLLYIRGYENLMLDMARGEPRLSRLLESVERFNTAVVDRLLGLGVEWMGYPEDLGMQRGPMLSPVHFRRYFKPVFGRLMKPAREAGCVVHMHSDGDIRDLVGDLLEDGVDVLNLQDLVNGVDWIKANLTGRVCVDLDVDRQSVTHFGTREDIDGLIRGEVEKLGSREGGLMMVYGLYPGVPLANAGAVMDAMERYAGFYS